MVECLGGPCRRIHQMRALCSHLSLVDHKLKELKEGKKRGEPMWIRWLRDYYFTYYYVQKYAIAPVQCSLSLLNSDRNRMLTLKKDQNKPIT